MSASLPPAPSAGATLRRLWAFTRPHARRRNALLLLVLVRACQLPALAWATAALISGPVTRADLGRLVLGCAGLLGLVLATEAVFVFRMRLALELGEAVVHDLRNSLWSRLMEMPLEFYDRWERGHLISRMTADCEAVRVGVQDVLFVGVVQLGVMLVTAGLMLAQDWLLFLVVVAIVPVLWGLLRRFHSRIARATREVQQSFSRVTASLAENVTGIREIQGFSRQRINGGLFRELIYDHSHYNMGVARNSAVFLPLLEFNGQLFLALLIVVGGYRALAGEMELESVLQFFFLSSLFFGAVPILGTLYNQALAAAAGAERVLGLLDLEPRWRDTPKAALPAPLAGKLEFRNVSLSYQPGRSALHELDFVVEAGQTVAIVGESGSGKSSVLRLSSKLYLPSSGAVLVDGIDLADVKSEDLHARMGYVLQTNFLFSGTVHENVALGATGVDAAAIERAARELDVWDLFEQLPEGLATRVGERGLGLSAGQRQLVCLLRAMLRDPRIVVLDEATSAIDPLTEARLQRALDHLLKGRTALIAAHRLRTIRNADRILVLHQGRLAEAGTHAELIARGGRYAALFRDATLTS